MRTIKTLALTAAATAALMTTGAAHAQSTDFGMKSSTEPSDKSGYQIDLDFGTKVPMSHPPLEDAVPQEIQALSIIPNYALQWDFGPGKRGNDDFGYEYKVCGATSGRFKNGPNGGDQVRSDMCARADVHLFGQTKEVVRAQATAITNSKAPGEVGVEAFILGKQLIDQHETGTVTSTTASKTFQKTMLKKSKTFWIPIGAGSIPITTSITIGGEIGFGVTPAIYANNAVVTGGAWVGADVAGRAALGTKGVHVGIEGELQIIDVSFNPVIQTKRQLSPSQVTFSYNAKGPICVESLAGKLSLVASLKFNLSEWGTWQAFVQWVKDTFDISIKDVGELGKEWKKTLTQWNGVQGCKTLFEKSGSSTKQLFDEWQY